MIWADSDNMVTLEAGACGILSNSEALSSMGLSIP